MAKGRIKGITIEIGGDTKAFQRSLKEVDDKLEVTQNNLKDINKLLKLDPKNTELLKQKQENLSKAIDETKQRLETLNKAYQELSGKNTDEAKEQQKALAREIIDTEQKLKSLENQYRDFGSVAKQQLKAVGDEIKGVGTKMSDVGKDLSMKLTAPLVAIGAVGINYNAQIEQYRTMFTTLTGSAEEADKIIQQLQADAQKSPFDSSSLIQANQYLISAGVSADEARQTILDLGNAVSATGGGSAELERMAQNLQQIKNVGKASSQDIKQFANAGINIYGLLAEATGKSVEQVKDMDVSYELLADALAKASQEGGAYYGAMEAQGQTLNGSLSATKESIQMLLGEITQSAMPIIVQVLNKVREIIDFLSNLDDGTKQTILIVGSLLAVLGPVITVLGGIVTAVGAFVSGLGMLMNPITLVIGGIGLLVASVNWLNNNMETVQAVFSSVWERVKTDFTAIVDFFKEKIQFLVDKFVAFKEAIINAFSFDSILGKVGGFFSSIGGMFGSSGFASGGFNGMSSGGSIILNANFTVNSNNVTEAMVRNWANVMTEQINENLGRMI